MRHLFQRYSPKEDEIRHQRDVAMKVLQLWRKPHGPFVQTSAGDPIPADVVAKRALRRELPIPNAAALNPEGIFGELSVLQAIGYTGWHVSTMAELECCGLVQVSHAGEALNLASG